MSAPTMRPVLTATMAATVAEPHTHGIKTEPAFQLRYLGDPVLWTRCVEVESLADVPIGLVNDMRAVVNRYRAMGLAANQVGALVRVALIRWDGNLHACINPRILERSAETQRELEGCLSIPEWTTTIERPRTVDLEYRDEAFELKRVTLGGFSARCAVHEVDHLNGKLIVDGLSRQQRRQAERFTAKYRADSGRPLRVQAVDRG